MILLLAACAADDRPLTWQDEYELLVLNADATLVDLRFSVSNTGTLKGMGHARGEIARKKEATIRLGFDAWPDEMETAEGVRRIGPDYLEQQADGWQVLFREGDDLSGYRDLRMSLAGSDIEVPAHATDGWTVDPVEVLGTASGVLAASGRQRILRGPGVLIRRYGDAPPALDGQGRRTVIVRDEGVSIGAEQVGEQTWGWASLDGQVHAGLQPKMTWTDRATTLDFRPDLELVVEVAHRKPEVTSTPWEALSGPERTLGGAVFGEPTRHLHGGLAEFEVDGEVRSALALLVEVEVP